MSRSISLLLLALAVSLAGCAADDGAEDAPGAEKPEQEQGPGTPSDVPADQEPDSPAPDDPEPVIKLSECFVVGWQPPPVELAVNNTAEVQTLPLMGCGGRGCTLEIAAGPYDGWRLAHFEARFSGGHFFQAWEADDLLIVRDGCVQVAGEDPGNGYPQAVVSMEPGESVYVLVNPSSAEDPGILLFQPELRPSVPADAPENRLYSVRAFDLRGIDRIDGVGAELVVDVEWRVGEADRPEVFVWTDDELEGRAARYYLGDNRGASTVFEIYRDAFPQSIRVALGSDDTVLDEVMVEIELPAEVGLDEECDMRGVRSYCTAETTCVARVCKAE